MNGTIQSFHSHTAYSFLEEKVTEALVPVLKDLIKAGFSEHELKAATAGIVFGQCFQNKLNEWFDPDPQDWKYDLTIGHINNIIIYKRVYRTTLTNAREVCDDILKTLSKEAYKDELQNISTINSKKAF